MDSPRSNASHEEKNSPLNDQSQSSEETIPAEDQPQPLDVNQIAIPDQDREYGCKYCEKKFSNKQALGGHQNAHKLERTMEKTARDVQESNLGYFGGTSATPFLTSYHRSHGFMNRSFVSWPYPSQQQGIHIGYNNSRPGLPMSGEPYAPRPHPGFNNVYSGWSPPVPRTPQFPGQPSYMPNHGLNLRFSNMGESSSSLRPASNQGLSAFAGSRIRPDRNPGGGNNNRLNVPGDEDNDDSGLDLSLKL